MSAVLRTQEAAFEPMNESRLDEILRIEQSAYAHPWSRGNFSDSLRAGYQAQLLVADAVILGYFVAMKGVDEVHLLNITVAPAYQSQGWPCGRAARAPNGSGWRCAAATCAPRRSMSGRGSAASASARATTRTPTAGARTRSS